MASLALTPRFRSWRKRVPGRVHCFQTTARSRRRIHLSRRRRIVGVSQKPKYARHPSRYAASSFTIWRRLTPRTRRVSFRTRARNRTNVLSARRRFGRWPCVKLKPRNVRSRAAATALFATFDFEFQPRRDEERNARHHAMSRSGTAYVHITVSHPGESHPQVLAEPYLNVPAHTAPSIRPPGRRPSRYQWANSLGSLPATPTSQCAARRWCRRSRLYFRMAQRTRRSLR